MRKHFLRTLVVMLIACLGVGVLAACGGTTNEDPVADPIEGVWSGATGDMEGATLTIDVDGNTAHLVQKTGSGEHVYYVYATLAKAADGGYSFTQEGQGTLTLKVNEENKLDYSVTPPADASASSKTENYTFATKATLPAAADITGTKYATVVGEVAEITFGSAPAIKYGEDTLTNVKLIDVGGYKVLTAKYDEDDVTVIAFKEGTANKVFVSLAYAVYDLSDTKPTPAGDTYTVNFQVGTLGTTTGTISYTGKEEGSSVALPNVVAKKGYTFNGWKIGSKTVTGSYTVDADDATSGTITVTADYTAITYTVKFDVTKPAGVTADVEGAHDNGQITITNNTVTFPAVTLDGYTLSGWKLNGGSLITTTIYTVAEADLPANDITPHEITFTAQWAEEGTYTVTFDIGEGGTTTGTTSYTGKQAGNTVDVPAVTAKKGYTFNGWKIGSKTVTDTYTVADADATSGTITITADYTLITYTVKFDVTKPAGVAADVEGAHDNGQITITNREVSFPTVTLDGYTLSGWKLNGGSLITASTYTVAEADLPENSAATHEITFTAQWAEEGTYTVTFDIGEGGTTTDTDSYIGKRAGNTVDVPAVTAKKGYTFNGWKLNGTTVTGTYTVADADATSGTITITAEYTLITYTVIFDVTTPAGVTATVEGAHDNVQITITNREVTLPTVALAGYTLSGWKLNGGSLITTTTYTVAEADLPANDAATHEITFTAQWVKTFAVTFDIGEGGTTTGTTSYTGKQAGNTVDVPAVTEKKGYTFNGWKLNGTTVTDTYTVAEADATDGTITITADYTIITYTVKFDVTKPDGVVADVVNAPADGQITVKNRTVTFSTVALAGYTLSGWKLNGGSLITTTTYTVAEEDLPANDAATHEITFTAQWKVAPAPASAYVGLWTNGQNSVTIVLGAESDTLCAVVKTVSGRYVSYAYYALAKDDDGFTGGGATFVLEEGTLTVTDPDEQPTTFTEHDTNPGTNINLSGTYSSAESDKMTWIIDFEEKTWSNGPTASNFVGDPINVGGYLVILAKGVITFTYIVYQDGEDYYAYQVGGSEDAPRKLQEGLPEVEYTIIYEGTNVDGIEDPNKYHVGDPVPITSKVPTPRWGWTFDGWYIDDDEVLYGQGDGLLSTYPVNAADADEYFHEITFTAKWTRIPAEERIYTIKFIDITGEDVTCPEDITGVVNTEVDIPVMQGVRDGQVFQGWALNGNEPLYKNGDSEHGKYTISADDMVREGTIETGEIRFYAAWDDSKNVDINGVWTDGDTIVAISIGDGDNNYAVIISQSSGYMAYKLSAAEGGSGYSDSEGSVTVALNAVGQLVVTIWGNATTLSTHKSHGENLTLEGTYTGSAGYYGTVTIDFETSKITVGMMFSDQEFNCVSVGAYTVLVVGSGEYIQYFVIYEDEGTYLLAGLDNPIPLTKQGGGPSTLVNIDGVWTNGNTTITVEGNKAVVKEDNTYSYYALTAEEGGYSYTTGLGQKVTLVLNKDIGKLTVTEGDGEGVDYTKGEGDLPEHLSITGTWKSENTDYEMLLTFVFTSGSCVVTEMGASSISTIDVGDYLIIPIDFGSTVYVVVFKSGDDYYIYEGTSFTSKGALKLEKQEEPDDISGVWTNGNTTITVEGNKAVIKEGDTYTYYILTADGKGYSYTPPYPAKKVTLVLKDAGTLTVTEEEGDGVDYTKGEPVDHISIEEGTWKSEDGSFTFVFTAEGGSLPDMPMMFTFEYVGDYLILVTDDPSIVVYKDGSGNYYFYCGGITESGPVKLVKQAAMPIEGVWTGATGDFDGYILTIELDGDTAHAVLLRNATDSNFVAQYWVFTKAQDGSYTFGDAENGTMSIKVNGTSLEFKITPPASAGDSAHEQTVIFTGREDLPKEKLDITGTKYAVHQDSSNYEVFEITFGAEPAIKFNETAATQVEAVDVGGYKVLSGALNGGNITVIVFEEESTYYAAIIDEHNIDRFTLSDTKPVQKFTVEFDLGEPEEAHGTTQQPDAQTDKEVGGEVDLSNTAIPVAPADDWAFDGWFTEKGTLVSGDKYTVSADDDVNKDGKITLTAHWTKLLPTVVLDDGNAEGEDITITAVREGSGDTYKITLPENTTYTAPEGTYFRGYTYNEETYFPGETITGIAAKATVNIAIVWETLTVTSEDTSIVGIWGGTAAQEILLRRGTTVKLEATYSALNADADHLTTFAGINVQIVNGIEFFFLRTDVEGALVTNGDFGTAQWRNASGRLIAHEIGATDAKFAITEYSDNNGTQITADAWLAAKLAGRTVIEIAFESEDKIVVTETYYTDKTGNTVYVSFAYTLSGLAASSYSVYFAAQQGTAVATSKLTTMPVSQNQNPSAENAVSFVGGLYYVAGWTTEIRKGETLELKGKATPQVDAVWRGYVASISQSFGVHHVLRMDDYILGASEEHTQAPTTDNGFSYTYEQEGGNIEGLTAQEYDTTVKVDWTDQSKIVISMTIGTVTTKWTIAADGGNLAEKYYFNLGADCCVANFTSAVRTAHTAATPAAD